MKEIKDVFPLEWKEAIELVEQKHIQACEDANINYANINYDYTEIALIAKAIMENLKITFKNAKYSPQDTDVPLIDTIYLLYNDDNKLDDHIVMMYKDKDYDEYKIASQGIYECIEGSYLELLNEFK